MVDNEIRTATESRFPPGHSTAVSSNVRYRLGKLRRFELLEGDWLDCGCADGGYTSAMAKMGVARVIGVDVEVERVSQAKDRNEFGSSVPSYSCASAEALPFPSASFNGVFLNEVLEHVANENRTLRELYRVLRPGGHLMVISPNRWFPFEGHGICVRGKTVEVPIPFLPWLPRKIAMRFMRARNYWPFELRNIVSKAGFEILSSGAVFPVFEVYPWLPAFIIPWYRRMVPSLEGAPIISRFGVSTFVLALRPTSG